MLVTKDLRSLLYHSLRELEKPNLDLIVMDAGKSISSSSFPAMNFVCMNFIRSAGDNFKDSSTTLYAGAKTKLVFAHSNK